MSPSTNAKPLSTWKTSPVAELWRGIQRELGITADGDPYRGTATAVGSKLGLVLPDQPVFVTAPPLSAVIVSNAIYSARTLKNLTGLNSKFRLRLDAFLAEAIPVMLAQGVTLEVICGLRDWATQAAIFAQPHDGKDNDGDGKIDEADEKVSNAPAGSSWHNYGLAIDMGLFKPGIYLDDKQPALAEKLYQILGPIAERCGLVWGGRWSAKNRDIPHLEYHPNLSLAEARAKMLASNHNVQSLL